MELIYKGRQTWIDDEDAYVFELCKWNLGGGTYRYWINSRIGSLHRFLMNCPDQLVVDHKNGNTLDNRKANLRICTRQENVRAARKRVDNTSGYRGVQHVTNQPPGPNPWRAVIKVNYKKIHLGVYPTRELAAAAYREAAEKYFGEFTGPQ